ncbi:uncharacterized protein LOC115883112 [Sitophilus oryzae]|uniref:Methylated-DNA--protein-cysteine methyltransferase n=1 Tax=Sitophilus oryzae TaxID=7048 RepID=A0A6J2Y2X2_SITOR|nr:uncharacterized protein LOC115883112 [Sitophilus oryzae]
MNLLDMEISSTRTIAKTDKYCEQTITYFCKESPLGKYFSAFYGDELCYLKFYDTDYQNCLGHLQKLYPDANLCSNNNFEIPPKLKILLKGSDFDVKVWKELLNIKKGKTLSYSDVAISIGNPKSVRAVGNAVGRNNIVYIVPCHRVIQKAGTLGGFGCGPHKKLKMLSYEGVNL